MFDHSGPLQDGAGDAVSIAVEAVGSVEIVSGSTSKMLN
jgi:hypothetical protein